MTNSYKSLKISSDKYKIPQHIFFASHEERKCSFKTSSTKRVFCIVCREIIKIYLKKNNNNPKIYTYKDD